MKRILPFLFLALIAIAQAQEIGTAWLVRQRASPIEVAFAPLGDIEALFGVRWLSPSLSLVAGLNDVGAPSLGGAVLFSGPLARNASWQLGPALTIENGGRWVPGLALGASARLGGASFRLAAQGGRIAPGLAFDVAFRF